MLRMVKATQRRRKKASDQHKSSFLIRLPEQLRERLRRLKEQTERPMTVDVRRAVEEYLKKHGL